MEDISPPSARRLLLAALDLFSTIGYKASTTRQIAERAGMSPAAVYVHYSSKEALLQAISRIGHESAWRVFEAGLQLERSPTCRLRDAISGFARWHAENQAIARVVQYELEALSRDGQREIRGLRARFEKRLIDELERGVTTGDFVVGDARGVATAMFSLCIDVARWYSPRSRRSPSEIGSLYGDLCVRMVSGSAPADR
jgi:AcrR family transcriptional regulator